jgi:hypothetical protein
LLRAKEMSAIGTTEDSGASLARQGCDYTKPLARAYSASSTRFSTSIFS